VEPPLPVHVIGEDAVHAAVGRRVCASVGVTVSPTPFVLRGKSRLDRRLKEYARAATVLRFLVLRDLDHDAECAPALLRGLAPRSAPGLMLRVPVREVESWLLGHSVAFAKFLGVSEVLIPRDPESLPDPKAQVVRLARRSRRREIREGLVPYSETFPIGPEYNSLVSDFAANAWDPAVAASRCDSLSRCLARLACWADAR